MFRGLADAVAIARSGMVDREYYEAVVGRRFPNAIAAAQHFLAAPNRAELSLHPLFEPAYLERKADPDLLLAYLREPSRFKKQSPHPCFDLATAKRALRAAGVESADGAWLAWVRTAEPTTPVPVARAGADRTVLWGELRAALIRAAVQWREGTTGAAIDWDAAARAPRHGSRTSIVVPIAGELAKSLRRLTLLKGEDDRELVCTGFASRAQFCVFSGLAQVRPLVVVPGQSHSVAQQWNAGAVAASGERLVFVAPNATLRPEAVAELVGALDDPLTGLAQPLNETPAMTIHSAGAYFAPGEVVPSRLLSDHPTSDVGTQRVAVPATHSGVIALASGRFFELHGFDERYRNDLADVDLSLRSATSGGGAVLVPVARAVVQPPTSAYPSSSAASAALLRASHNEVPTSSGELLQAAGFEVVGHRTVESAEAAKVSEPVLRRPRVGVEALPSLRWTIDTPVTAGWWAQIWGDWHFANSLARALRRLGQQVAVDTKQARERPTRSHDDVLLTVRGLEAVAPAPGRVNLMWVISHPDEVRPDEIAGYDRVFAASHPWSAEKSAEWGVPIEPLLQCTEAELFHPGRAVGEPNERALFVGNIRPDRTRPMVDAAIAAGIGLDVYGTGWEATPAASNVVARNVANEDLGRLYAEAGLVLNDHWPDMRRLGFISNRIFDAVACGARVLSDRVVGAAELFNGGVVFCDDAPDAVDLLRRPLDVTWPDQAARLRIAESVRREHSFDARAKVLLEAAVAAIEDR